MADVLARIRKYVPIRKIAVTFVGGALTWAALRLGLDLGSDAANQAATVIVGLAFGYMEKDPRVVTLLKPLMFEGKIGEAVDPSEKPAE